MRKQTRKYEVGVITSNGNQKTVVSEDMLLLTLNQFILNTSTTIDYVVLVT